MSQLAVGPRKNIERQNWTEITPQALYDKCLSLAKNLWWSWHPEVVNLFRDLDPIKWRKIDHNPIVLLAEMTPEQVAERAAEMVLYTRINQAHRRLKEYLTNTRHTLGRPRDRRARLAAGRLFLRRVRHARIGADLLRRPGRALGRPHQERQQPGRAAGGDRPVLRPGLFQAAPRRQRLSSRKSISTRASRTCRWSRRSAPTASRSRSRSKPATAGCWPRSG